MRAFIFAAVIALGAAQCILDDDCKHTDVERTCNDLHERVACEHGRCLCVPRHNKRKDGDIRHSCHNDLSCADVGFQCAILHEVARCVDGHCACGVAFNPFPDTVSSHCDLSLMGADCVHLMSLCLSLSERTACVDRRCACIPI